jgi:DNA recombination protein RmuC
MGGFARPVNCGTNWQLDSGHGIRQRGDQMADIFMVAALVAVAIVFASSLILMQRRSTRAASLAVSDALAEVKANFSQRIADRDAQLTALKQELASERSRFAVLQDQFGALQARNAAGVASAREQAEQNERRLAEINAARLELSNQFKALAGDIFKTERDSFIKQNHEQMDLVLKPLRERIAEFQKGLTEDRATLLEQVKVLTNTSTGIQEDATNLARALRGSTQMQGAWGEMILETVLQSSGLRKDEQYRTHAPHQADNGARLQTDVEVMLPQGDSIVIDSKVSLLDYIDFVNATDDESRQSAQRRLVASMFRHIEILSRKEYHRNADSGFDFVLMFIPIEGAFAAAVNAEPKLLQDALSKQVCLTTPSTLMSTLRAVSNVWQIERRQRNAEEIADRAGQLYDKVVLFLESMEQIDKALSGARRAYDTAHARLTTGSGNVVRQIQMLRQLGAKANKPLGSEWQPATDIDDEPADEETKLLFQSTPVSPTGSS